MNDGNLLDKATTSDLMIVDPVNEADMSDYVEEKEGNTYDPDTYCILAFHTQWLFHFKNVSPLPKNAILSKYKLLADPLTATKVKSKDKKNLNNMGTAPVKDKAACSKVKTATPLQ
jgi:hypothetical protein